MKFSALMDRFGRKDSIQYRGKQITVTESTVSIDDLVQDFEFSTRAEAVAYAKNQIDSLILSEQVRVEIIEEMADVMVAECIKSVHNVSRSSKQLIEQYKSLCASKEFTLDEVVVEMRMQQPASNYIPNKIDFKLEDGSVVAISESYLINIRDRLNNLNENKEEVLTFMKKSKDNFLFVAERL